MNSFRNLLLLTAVLSLCLATGGCSPSGDDDQADGTADSLRSEPVRIIEMQYTEIARRVTYSAHLHAQDEVHLAPASPGRVDRLHVDVGDRVRKGQLLVEMDSTQLQQATVQLRRLETDFRRLDTLRKAGSVSQYQFDQLKTQLDIARSNVSFLRDNTTLRAPYSATVSGRYYESGEMYSGAPTTPAGKAAVLSLVNTDRLKAMINVAERYYPQVKTGLEVDIRADVYPDRSFSGRVTTVHPTVDPATRTFTVEITVPNTAELLRPGMFARAVLDLERVRAFLAPAIAVMKLQGSDERFVFLEEAGMARRVTVALGDRHDDQVEILSDAIEAGDHLIVAGQSKLVDQTPVTVQH
ncbi:MAG: efflux RND transporter periplasmic adaptor subunit [Bacteroidetes bacterium]|nr:efflux RND transporter periplasmic adaptor subunit [Bacteroidota bacterium]